MAILGVFGSLMGSVLCFLKGCVYVLNSFIEYTAGSGKVILMVVEAIDVYLIGTVMLVFGMGLYELFISNLDIAKTSSYGSNLLGLFKLSVLRLVYWSDEYEHRTTAAAGNGETSFMVADQGRLI
ncbi:uncharacterized protein A4U43_C08F560 [Asparagus officinalis]|nr:uncharacterized protein A4U43_C08F560 [Asparagus officinalis]